MDGLVQYLISITAAAIICGIAKETADEKSASGTMIRLIAGLIMAFTVFSPVIDMELGDLPELPTELFEEAETVSARGQLMAAEELDSIITDKLEAYILDKAASIGADVQVELRLEDCRPAGIAVYGSVSPGQRQRLQKIFEAELGIAKEKQQWKK